MTDIIIHLGANKTGSSSIQRFIQKNVEKLKELNFIIPDHLLGLSEKITGEQVFALQEFIGGGDKSTANLKKKIDSLLKSRESEDQTLLISAENMGTTQGAKLFKKVLAKRDAKVIFYIRRQDELIDSSWQQWHSKKEQDHDAWLINAIRTLGHWEQILNGWESVVGLENVHVEVFERSVFPEGNIIRDFIEKLGLGDHADEFELKFKDANPSFSGYITPLVSGNDRIFTNIHDNEFYRMVGALSGDKYTKEKKYSLMSQAQRENIMKYFSNQNERVRAKFFPDRERLFAEINHEKYQYASKEEMLDLQLRFITTMIYEMGRKIV